MSHATDELKSDLKKSVATLQTLRDETRVRLHLAGMDAKDRWRELEVQLAEAEQAAERAATEATREAVERAIVSLEKFRESLH